MQRPYAPVFPTPRSSDLDRLERSEITSFQYRRYYEAFPWFGLASFALWVLVGLLELTFWRRVPAQTTGMLRSSGDTGNWRSEEHTSELQSLTKLLCLLPL